MPDVSRGDESVDDAQRRSFQHSRQDPDGVELQQGDGLDCHDEADETTPLFPDHSGPHRLRHLGFTSLCAIIYFAVSGGQLIRPISSTCDLAVTAYHECAEASPSIGCLKYSPVIWPRLDMPTKMGAPRCRPPHRTP